MPRDVLCMPFPSAVTRLVPQKPLMLTGGTDGTARLCNIDTHRVLSALRPASKPGQARRESSIEGSVGPIHLASHPSLAFLAY